VPTATTWLIEYHSCLTENCTNSNNIDSCPFYKFMKTCFAMQNFKQRIWKLIQLLDIPFSMWFEEFVIFFIQLCVSSCSSWLKLRTVCPLSGSLSLNILTFGPPPMELNVYKDIKLNIGI
jgi:hypothetical protein